MKVSFRGLGSGWQASLLAGITFAASLQAAPVINTVTVNPAVPGNFDAPTVSASVHPGSGATLSQVQLQYNTGAVTTSTAFRETMSVTSNGGWNGTGGQNVWTVVAVRGGGDVRQRSGTGNHTVPVLLTNCTTNGTTTVTCASTAAIWPGMSVTGTSISAGTTIATVPNATTFTINQISSGSGSGLTLTAAGVTLTNCATTATTTKVTCDSTVGLVAGMAINVVTTLNNPSVASITDATTFVMSSNAAATNSGLTLTASGCGVEMSTGTVNYPDTMITTTNAINASGATSGAIEFYVRTAGLISNNGWILQVSPDGGTTWNPRVSETYAGSTITLANTTLNATTTVACTSTSGLVAGMAVQGPTLRVNNCVTGGTSTLTCPDTTGLVPGMFISGTGIPGNSRVVSVVTNTSFTLNNIVNTSATVSVLANYFNANTTVTSVTNGTTFVVNNVPFYSGGGLSVDATTINHGFALKHYDLTAGELTANVKLRFQFSGYLSTPPVPTPACDIDDVIMTLTSGTPPVTLTMADDGAHGDGAAGDGVYGATIPAQAGGTTVNYTVAATDSAGSTSSNGSYLVATVSPALAVTPATSFSSGGAVAGPFSPTSTIYTLTNTGTGSLQWNAGQTASWCTISPGSGTLSAGASVNVTVAINASANSLSGGSYANTVTFTNATNATGTTTRDVTLTPYAPPATPVLVSSGAYGRGTSQTLRWSAVSGATGYTLQLSTSAAFDSLVSTQTVTTASAPLVNLIEGAVYCYRVLATNPAGSSAYSNVIAFIPDATPPTVAITSPANNTTTTTTASITVTGTSSDALSGIAKVSVNSIPVTTTNNYATWTVTVPLGFGTTGITATATDAAGNFTTTLPVPVELTTAQTYNPLFIPDTMTGTTFNLTLDISTKRYFTGATTNTYGYNHALFWGPTLIMKKGDFVQVYIKNNLPDTTTTHWHGFHIPAIMDGGPHQTIPAGTTWSSSFYVKNQAATFWYHPHLHTTTQQQLTMGAGGLIIIQDDEEAALALPRTYGVDDFPIILTSRRVVGQGAGANQFALNGAFGDFMLVNGTINPQVSLPAQVVRLRILDAEIARNHNLGFSDNRTFYVIGTDGGLLNAPVPVTRMVMGSAERYEILVDLHDLAPGASLDLMTYNTNQVAGYSGGQVGTTGANGSLLNNLDFVDLHINIAAATANPITSIPTTLAHNVYWTNADVTNNRTVSITGVNNAPLSFDNQVYSSTFINQTVNFNAVEQWTLANVSNLAHTFHIHDIQFYLTSVPGAASVPAYMQGWKDSFIIPQQSSVSFITKFDDFASNTNPFMFHCHFLQHEDAGLMGQFLVQNNEVEDLAIASFTRNTSDPMIHLQFRATAGTTYTVQYSPDMNTGSWVDVGSVTSNGSSGDFMETNLARLGLGRGYYRIAMPTISE